MKLYFFFFARASLRNCLKFYLKLSRPYHHAWSLYHEKEIYINGFLAHFTDSNLNLTDSSSSYSKIFGADSSEIALFSMLIKVGGHARFQFFHSQTKAWDERVFDGTEWGRGWILETRASICRRNYTQRSSIKFIANLRASILSLGCETRM